MSEASIYLYNQVIYVPQFDGDEFDMDMFPRCEAETMEGWL